VRARPSVVPSSVVVRDRGGHFEAIPLSPRIVHFVMLMFLRMQFCSDLLHSDYAWRSLVFQLFLSFHPTHLHVLLSKLPCSRVTSESSALEVLTLTIMRYTNSRTHTPKSSHITPIILSLRWLKITQRIEYKLLSLTYKVLTTTQPSYLHNLIIVQPPRSTRSSSLVTLARPSTWPSLRITDRFFHYASPRLWNQLPASVGV